MDTKNKILELLERNRGKSLSGEEIAGLLGISRSAVWKAIKSLKNDGHIIVAVTNRGYSLSNDDNILSVAGLLPYLSNNDLASKIYISDSLESTNKTAKEMAINGYEHGTVVIADTQTSGKGRYGRHFYSPPRSGLYMSFILRPQFLDLQNTTFITIATAVAVCKAIQTVTHKEPKIKWVNDILLDDKKICGILTEAITDYESNNIDWIVVGIGINICTDDFPNELSQVAGSLFPHETTDGAIRNRLGAEIINILLSSNDWAINNKIYSEYRNRLMLLGKVVTVIEPNGTYEALAADIDTNGGLIVKKDNGEIVTLSSTQVSVKNT